jgi:tripartite-type tricarboxylate transporter receptor subunit TctC
LRPRSGRGATIYCEAVGNLLKLEHETKIACGRIEMGRALVALMLLLAAVTQAAAQGASDDWPKRPIRLIVSAAPGSAGDTVCRIVAQKLTERISQPFVFDNRPAAGGTVASEGLAHSQPDGYTFGLVTTSTHVIATIFSAGLPYDPVKDFAPVSVIGSSPYVLAVYPGLPAKNVAELVALAKAKPKQLNNAAFGTTSLGYLAGVLFAQYTGVELNEVSYRSSAQAVIDTVAGRVEMQFSTLAPAIPLIQEGKLRALATTGAQRVPTLPDIPTLAEQGLTGYDVALWMGIAAPAGTPPAIVERLNREMTAVLALPEVKSSLLQAGMVAEPGPASDLAGRIRDDLKKWRDVANKAGIKQE